MKLTPEETLKILELSLKKKQNDYVLQLKGDKGDKPRHKWTGTSLSFENPDGSWGSPVNLKGEEGKPSPIRDAKEVGDYLLSIKGFKESLKGKDAEIPRGFREGIIDELDTKISSNVTILRNDITGLNKTYNSLNKKFNSFQKEVNDKLGKNLEDAILNIRDNLSSLEGDSRIDRKAIKGLEKVISQEDLDRALSILDKRTQYLISKNSGGTWGSITGTLSNQTDLQSALDAKIEDLSSFDTGDLTEGANLYFTDERAQDAVGTILTDSSEIDFTYNDATPSITASIVAGSIDETKLDTSVNASLDLADSALQAVAEVNLTGQTSSISATTAYSVPASRGGMYVVYASAKITRAATTSSTLGVLDITFTSPTDSIAATVLDGNVNNYNRTVGNTTADGISMAIPVYAKAGTNIQYAMGYASSGATSMEYELHIKVVYLG